MDFGKAFSFPFHPTRWVEQLLIPALITLIPVFGQIYLAGWYLDITRRVIRGDADPLPDLDIGRHFVDGLKAVVIGLVYAIPLLVLVVPVVIATNISTNGDNQGSNAVVALTMLCFVTFMAIYTLALAFVLPAALGNFVAKNDIAAAFRFPEVFGLLRAAPAAYLLVLLCTLLTSIIAPLGSALCVIGIAATTLYAMAVNGYLYGAAYLQTRSTGIG